MSEASEANSQLVQRWFEEVWNQKKEAAIDAMYGPESQSFGFPEPDSVIRGPEDFKAVYRRFCGAFPDLQVTLEDTIADGDRVAARWSVTMTHLGDHLGFPATGKKARINGSTFLVVRDGKISQGWNQMDMSHLYKQLGVAPA